MTAAMVMERTTTIVEREFKPNHDEIVLDAEMIRSLMRGLDDRKNDRMIPWSTLKAKFGLG